MEKKVLLGAAMLVALAALAFAAVEPGTQLNDCTAYVAGEGTAVTCSVGENGWSCSDGQVYYETDDKAYAITVDHVECIIPGTDDKAYAITVD